MTRGEVKDASALGYREAYNNLINLLFMQKRLDEVRTFLSQAEAQRSAINSGLKKTVLETAEKQEGCGPHQSLGS